MNIFPCSNKFLINYFYFRSISEIIVSIDSQSTSKRKKKEDGKHPDFQVLELADWDIRLPGLTENKHIPVINFRSPLLALTLFNFFLPETLLEKIWDDTKLKYPVIWRYGSTKPIFINKNQFRYRTILCLLACQIRIIGLQNKPKENSKNLNPLRGNLDEARDHFKTVIDEANPNEKKPNMFPGIEILQVLCSRFLFDTDYHDLISENFQKAVKWVGEYLAGDEKLLHFTGDSDNIRMVLTKPDKVGHWFYELCIKLSNGLSFLLHFRAHLSDPNRNISIKTSEIVEQWTTIATTLGGENANPDAITTADSYYFDTTGRNICNDKKKKFVVGLQKNRFVSICDHLSGLVHAKKEVAAAYNEKTNEILVKYWDPEHPQPKFVLSNAFKLTKITEKTKQKSRDVTIPVYSEYAEMFNLCDRFNRNLHERTWPHKTGGKSRKGEHGQYHNFALSAILQNIFNLYHDVNGEDHTIPSFKDFFCNLADDIVRYAFFKIE